MHASISFIPNTTFASKLAGRDSYKGKGKASVLPPVSPVQDDLYAVSPVSSGSASDNEDEMYFSDASSASSRSSYSSGSSHTLGDFVFENDQDYEDYFSIVHASVEQSPPTSSASSSSISAFKASKKAKTRKGSSGFFLSGPSFATMPVLHSSVASQNPSLSRAHASLSAKLQKIARRSSDFSSREATLQTEETDRRFERALMFAQWQQREGQWQAPKNASGNIVMLVSKLA